MKTLLEKIRNFFNTTCRDQEIEERFYQRLEDMKEHPEKYQHILNRNSGSSKIPPVSVF
jgi:hypothetical protein